MGQAEDLEGGPRPQYPNTEGDNKRALITSATPNALGDSYAPSETPSDHLETIKSRDIVIQPTPLTISTDDPAAQAEDKIPDGGYGWVIVGCTLSCNAATWGDSSHYY